MSSSRNFQSVFESSVSEAPEKKTESGNFFPLLKKKLWKKKNGFEKFSRGDCSKKNSSMENEMTEEDVLGVLGVLGVLANGKS